MGNSSSVLVPSLADQFEALTWLEEHVKKLKSLIRHLFYGFRRREHLKAFLFYS